MFASQRDDGAICFKLRNSKKREQKKCELLALRVVQVNSNPNFKIEKKAVNT